MSTTLLHRLIWKEVRVLRALWFTLLGIAVILQGFASWAVGNRWSPPQINFLVPIWIPVLFTLASAAVAFAGEREDGTDQLLNRLAVPPLALWSTKLIVNVIGTALLAMVLFPFAWGMGWLCLGERWRLLIDVAREGGPVRSIAFLALLWQVGFLAWGMLLSLLCRRVLSCLIVTTVAAGLTPLFVGVALESLPFRWSRWEWVDWTARVSVVPGSLLLASVWLVQRWDENRWPRLVERLLDGWCRLAATRDRTVDSTTGMDADSGGWRPVARRLGLCLPDEWLPSWRREARRLLWLECRQARRVMLFVGAAFALYLVGQATIVTSGFKLLIDESPFVLALTAFVFGVCSFQAQQSVQQFRDYARHGVSPSVMWVSKQGTWLLAMFVTVSAISATMIWLCTADVGGPSAWTWRGTFLETLLVKLAYGFQWHKIVQGIDPQRLRESAASLWMNSAMTLGLCFAVGQFVSLLIPRAVTASMVGLLLAIIDFGWQQLTAHLAVPSGLAVLPLVVGLLLASFVRMSDWLEERNSVRGWLKVALALGVPTLVTLIGVPIYRVWEIPPTTPDWQQWLDEATTPPSLAAKQTAEAWIRAAQTIDDEPVFRWKKREKPTGTNAEIEVEHEYSPDYFFDLRTELVTWGNLKNRDWVTRHAGVLDEASRIAQEPDCAFDRPIFDASGNADIRPSYTLQQLSRLAVLLTMAAESALSDGRLDDGLQHSLNLYRFSRHMQQHGGWDAVFAAERLELVAWSLFLDWARHPAQTGDSLRATLGRTVGAVEHPLHKTLFPEFKEHILIGNAVGADYAAAKKDLSRRWQEELWPASWLIWERQREERLLDYLALAANSKLTGFVHEAAAFGFGESQFIREIPDWQNGDRADFLFETTRSLAFFHWDTHYRTWQRANERGQTELRRRALLVTLALRAFHLDHSRWPTQWEELLGAYLGGIPVDPWTGQPFEYRPDGFPFDLRVAGRSITAKTPLFLSGGPYRQHLVPTVPRPDSSTAEGMPSQLKWSLVSKYGRRSWPVDGNILLEFVCFPLNATEPKE